VSGAAGVAAARESSGNNKVDSDGGFDRSAFDQSGGFEYEYTDSDREIDEWRAAVENFDPSKIGLPDS